MQWAAVNMNLTLIIEPPQSVPQVISSRITCQGASPSASLKPFTIFSRILTSYAAFHDAILSFIETHEHAAYCAVVVIKKS